MIIQDLLSESAVKTLDVGILSQLTGLDIAQQNVIVRRPPCKSPGDKFGTIVSPDGLGFASSRWYKKAKQAKMRISMSGIGNCYDNACGESFFATLKLEAMENYIFRSKSQAKAILFDYIEVFYNRQPLHLALDFQTSVAFAA